MGGSKAIPPIDCSYVPLVADIDLLDDTEKLVGVLTHGSHEPHAVDSDLDGCTDAQELGSNPTLGGGRDPLVFWDFFDANRDGSVSGLDFFSVLGRFNSTWETPLTEEEAIAQALVPPPPPPAYHTSHDHAGGSPPGAFNTTPPDGSISGLDFFAVLAQFNHQCS